MRQVAALVIVDIPDSATPNAPTEEATLDKIEELLERAGFASAYVEPYIGPGITP